jgi:hypothetical protein
MTMTRGFCPHGPAMIRDGACVTLFLFLLRIKGAVLRYERLLLALFDAAPRRRSDEPHHEVSWVCG